MAWNEGCAPAPYVAEVDEYVPVTLAVEDDLSAFIARAQAKKGIVPTIAVTEAPEVEEWQFTTDKATKQDSGDWLRYQYIPNTKKHRTVVVDEDDFEYVRRVL